MSKGYALYVSNPGGWAMVGRIFRAKFQGHTRWIFEHRHKDTQRHFLTESPGGYDRELLGFLASRKVRVMVDVELEAGKWVYRYTTLEKVVIEGELRPDGGRTRYFLPYSEWERFDPEYDTPPPNLPRMNVYLNEADYLTEYRRKLRERQSDG